MRVAFERWAKHIEALTNEGTKQPGKIIELDYRTCDGAGLGMTNVRERLAKALDNYEEERKESRQVVIAPSQHDRNLLIDTLTLLVSFDSGQPTRAFRMPSRERTQNELSDIATRASGLSTRPRDPTCSVTRAREQLAQRLEDMQETPIFAPSDLNIAFARLELPCLPRAETTDREPLANELALAQAAAAPEAPDSNDEGPWPDR